MKRKSKGTKKQGSLFQNFLFCFSYLPW